MLRLDARCQIEVRLVHDDCRKDILIARNSFLGLRDLLARVTGALPRGRYVCTRILRKLYHIFQFCEQLDEVVPLHGVRPQIPKTLLLRSRGLELLVLGFELVHFCAGQQKFFLKSFPGLWAHKRVARFLAADFIFANCRVDLRCLAARQEEFTRFVIEGLENALDVIQPSARGKKRSPEISFPLE